MDIRILMVTVRRAGIVKLEAEEGRSWNSEAYLKRTCPYIPKGVAHSSAENELQKKSQSPLHKECAWRSFRWMYVPDHHPGIQYLELPRRHQRRLEGSWNVVLCEMKGGPHAGRSIVC